jgi:preprotein translocase subunit SecB
VLSRRLETGQDKPFTNDRPSLDTIKRGSEHVGQQHRDTPSGGNGQAEAAGRQIVVHAQYIKDLSFENPNAPDILIDPPQQPDVQIGVNVGARGLNSEQYEVVLSLSANAKTEDKALFLAELTYAAIVSAPGASRDDLNPLIMIEAPRLMFPFARAIISDMTRDGGFMPLSIQPIDFVAVYQSNIERQKEALASSRDRRRSLTADWTTADHSRRPD